MGFFRMARANTHSYQANYFLVSASSSSFLITNAPGAGLLGSSGWHEQLRFFASDLPTAAAHALPPDISFVCVLREQSFSDILRVSLATVMFLSYGSAHICIVVLTCVLYPSGRLLMNLCAFAETAAAWISSSLAPLHPIAMFSAMVVAKSVGSWDTRPTCEQQ